MFCARMVRISDWRAKLILGLRWWLKNRLKARFLYRYCILGTLSVWDSMAVNDLKPTMDADSWWSIVPMFMCRQTGNLWFILIEKGREKKGWGNTLRQKGDFLGCFYSKSWCSPLKKLVLTAFFLQKSLAIQNKSSTFAPPEPAKPLNDAQMCGSFYFYTMSNRIPFQKPYTSAHDLVCLLQSRGLTVTDTSKAESYLEYIGYYRLSAYISG